MLNKNAFLILFILIKTILLDPIGTKMSLNLNLLQKLTTLNLSFLNGTEILNNTGISIIGDKWQIKYNIHLFNFSISELHAPKSVNVKIINGENKLVLTLNDIVLNLTSSLDLEIDMLLKIKDSFRDKITSVLIKSVDIKVSLDKTTKKVIFDYITVTLDRLDIPFNQYILKTGFKWLNPIILTVINIYTQNLKDLIEDSVNNVISDKHLYQLRIKDIATGIGFNYTVSDFPEVVLGSPKAVLHLARDHFLQEGNNIYLNIGTRSNFFPFNEALTMPDLPCKEIAFAADNFQKDLNFYLNDYTLNTGLYILQKYIPLEYKVTNDSLLADFHQINIDTKGIGSLVPEIDKHYVENKPMSLTVKMDNDKKKEFTIATSAKGLFIQVPISIDFAVFETNQSEEKILTLKLTLDIQGSVYMKNEKLNLQVTYVKIPILEAIESTIGTINVELLKINLEKLLAFVFDQLSVYTHDIDVYQELAKYSGLKVTNMNTRSFNGFLQISCNLPK